MAPAEDAGDTDKDCENEIKENVEAFELNLESGEDWKAKLRVARGFPLPLGVSHRAHGVNFAVYAREEELFSVVIYPPEDIDDSRRVEIKLEKKVHRTGQIWHVLISPYLDGFEYRFKVGDKDKSRWGGNMVIDPVSYMLSTPRGPDMFNKRSEPYQPRSVIPPRKTLNFDWKGILPPRIPMKDLVIYEMHVRGLTISPDSNVNAPGTFLGVLEKVNYFKSLGVNCVELLPSFEYNETEWDKKNPFTGKPLCQYWGYSTVNFFSPMNRFAYGKHPWSAVEEFKIMVRELHRAGIEVFLDVVFNHTAEFGDVFMGPGLFHFKGLAVDTYYIREQGKFHDYTGCGNTVNINNPIVAEWFHLCIRYWVHEMGVDGFRFDLAGAMCRNDRGEPMQYPPAIERITKDPSLRQIKFIAEPWDAVGLYLVGNFPHYGVWGEWNGKYRDTLRRFMKGDAGMLSDFATRFCGSPDLYGKGRKPYNSINFIVAHDGFSLYDLCSYNDKHNQENGENNNDGERHNDSWNCGVEGETGDEGILKLRTRQCKNFMVALMLSAGTPMILMGDEYSHSKGGNNNAWCQDQAKNYCQWSRSKRGKEMRRFVSNIIKFRHRNSFLKRDDFIHGDAIQWHGAVPFSPDWNSDYNFIAFTLVNHSTGEDIYAAFNAGHHFYGVTLPTNHDGKAWYRIVDTNLNSPDDFSVDERRAIEVNYNMAPYSSIVLKKLPRIDMSAPDNLRRMSSLRSQSFIMEKGTAYKGLEGLLTAGDLLQEPTKITESPSVVHFAAPHPIARVMSQFNLASVVDGKVPDTDEILGD